MFCEIRACSHVVYGITHFLRTRWNASRHIFEDARRRRNSRTPTCWHRVTHRYLVARDVGSDSDARARIDAAATSHAPQDDLRLPLRDWTTRGLRRRDGPAEEIGSAEEVSIDDPGSERKTERGRKRGRREREELGGTSE